MPSTTLAGIGSLVSEASARHSFAFTNFRIAEIRGWRRAFNQANWVNVQHGWGAVAADTTAALAMVPADAEFVSFVALLDVDDLELPAFFEREAGYHIRRTPYWQRDASGAVTLTGEALLCTACDDDEEADRLWSPGGTMLQQCSAGSTYAQDWMRKSLRPLWPPPSASLWPAPGYLRLCAAAHRRAGLLDHFLDSTVLNDRETTLREHCQAGEARAVLLSVQADGAGEEEESSAVPSVHGAARRDCLSKGE